MNDEYLDNKDLEFSKVVDCQVFIVQKWQDKQGGYDCTTLDEKTYSIRHEPTLELLDEDPALDSDQCSDFKLDLIEA